MEAMLTNQAPADGHGPDAGPAPEDAQATSWWGADTGRIDTPSPPSPSLDLFWRLVDGPNP